MWRRHWSVLRAFPLCLVAAGASCLFAQEAGTGTASVNTLAGTIVSESGAIPAGEVKAHAFHAASEKVFTTGVDPAAGRFLLPGLPDGSYQLWIETAEGLFPVADPVTLSGGVRRQVVCTLSPGPVPEPLSDRSPPAGLPDSPIAGFSRLEFAAPGGAVRTGRGRRNFLILSAVGVGYGLYEIIQDDDKDVSPSGP